MADGRNRNVNRIVSFRYDANNAPYERVLINLGAQTTLIERIPVDNRAAMRAWVQRLDRYIDAITPPEYTALAGVHDEDGDELTSARAKAAEVRDESRQAEARSEEEALDRLTAEGRGDIGDATERQNPPRQPNAGYYSRVDTGAAPYRDETEAADGAYDGYTRGARQGTYRRTVDDDYSAARRQPDAADVEGVRLTYGSARAAQEPAPQKEIDKRDYVRKQQPVPKPTEAVVDALDLHGALLNAGIADGSFLRYVLERQMFFTIWKKGWLHRGQRVYMSDATVNQATMAEAQLAKLNMDALRTRDRVSSGSRAERIADADVIFDNTAGFLKDAGGLNLHGKLLVCDTMRADEADALTHLGLSRAAVLTPYVGDTYVSMAELEAMLGFSAGREPRQLHLSDWVRLLETLRLRQDVFEL